MRDDALNHSDMRVRRGKVLQFDSQKKRENLQRDRLPKWLGEKMCTHEINVCVTLTDIEQVVVGRVGIEFRSSSCNFIKKNNVGN